MPNGTYGGVRGKETSRIENCRFPTYSIELDVFNPYAFA